MNLTKEQQEIYDGKQGATLAKVMQTLVRYGELFGADGMVPVTSKYNHLVTSFGLKALAPVYELMNQLIESGNVSKQKFSADPRPLDPKVPSSFLQDFVFKNFMYSKQDDYEKQLTQLGIMEKDAYTCTCYMDEVGNTPAMGEVLSWSESSAVVYANSVLGARCNRNSGIIDLMGSVVGYRDNFFAALNSAVFSDGSFVYIPKGVRCPMELSTYFRINARNTGQFERTLIVADDDSYVSYLEGCTAPMRDENQLHAAIVEIVVHDRAEVKYSTVQNWYPGDAEGKGGVYNFVTKRGNCKGVDSKLSWTQVETGSAITWKYPSCILTGDNSTAEFYSVAVTNNYQQADTGTKMIHLGKNTRSTIVSKGISAGHSENSYRGLVRVAEKADNARNYSQCDSLLLGDKCGAHTFPYMDIHNETAVVEHEATTSKISEDQIFYCNQRGIPTEDAIGLIVNGYAKEVLNKLPMEFAVEAQKLLTISLEGSVG